MRGLLPPQAILIESASEANQLAGHLAEMSEFKFREPQIDGDMREDARQKSFLS